MMAFRPRALLGGVAADRIPLDEIAHPLDIRPVPGGTNG